MNPVRNKSVFNLEKTFHGDKKKRRNEGAKDNEFRVIWALGTQAE